MMAVGTGLMLLAAPATNLLASLVAFGLFWARRPGLFASGGQLALEALRLGSLRHHQRRVDRADCSRHDGQSSRRT